MRRKHTLSVLDEADEAFVAVPSMHGYVFIHFIFLLFPLIQAYFRQGVALQYLGRHADALAAFASGLAQDPKSLQLLVGMVEAAMKSPLRGKLRPTPLVFQPRAGEQRRADAAPRHDGSHLSISSALRLKVK